MKIAELFVALGIQVEGGGKLDEVDRALNRTAMSGAKTALSMAALTASFLAMLNASAKAAVALNNYATATGLSTDELQRWQRVAATTSVPVDDVAATLKGLQETAAKIMLGGPASGIWGLLGITPHDNPAAILDKARIALSRIKDVGLARQLANQIGLSENMFRLLRASDEQMQESDKGLVVTTEQIDALRRLSQAWALFRYDLAASRTQFFSRFAPAFEKGIKFMGVLLREFIDLFAGSNGLIGLLGAAVVAIVAFQGPAIAAGLAVVGAWAPVLLLFAALALAIDDVVTGLTGGDGIFKRMGESIGEWLSKFETLLDIFNWMSQTSSKTALPSGETPSDLGGEFSIPGAMKTNNTSTVNSPITVNVSGNADATTVKKITSAVDNSVSEAYRSSPIYGY
jgi:hypothetical protein